MGKIGFAWEGSMVSDEKVEEEAKSLDEEIENMRKARGMKYGDDRASINLLDDAKMVAEVKKLAKEKRELEPTLLIVVGIGGSNLGTRAVQSAVHGRLYNDIHPDLRVFYVDTIDSDFLSYVRKILWSTLRKGENAIINCVTKSGTTMETIANFEILLDVLKKNKEEYEKYVVVTTDNGSKLWELAKQKNYSILEVPEKVGGRYSVFSPVGLFPLALIDTDIDQLLSGAREMRELCLEKNPLKNPAAMGAARAFVHYKEGRRIHNLFLFCNDYEQVGKWHRQLIGESLGKEKNVEGEIVNEGITPIFSIGTTDLHSVAQLYLGGPNDKFTTFVDVKESKVKVEVPEFEEYGGLVENIQGKPLLELMHATLKGVEKAFEEKKRPFMEITIPDKSEYAIGQFLQYKMMETIYLGALMEVNPFDQPNVEGYKKETRRILSEGKKL